MHDLYWAYEKFSRIFDPERKKYNKIHLYKKAEITEGRVLQINTRPMRPKIIFIIFISVAQMPNGFHKNKNKNDNTRNRTKIYNIGVFRKSYSLNGQIG